MFLNMSLIPNNITILWSTGHFIWVSFSGRNPAPAVLCRCRRILFLSCSFDIIITSKIIRNSTVGYFVTMVALLNDCTGRWELLYLCVDLRHQYQSPPVGRGRLPGHHSHHKSYFYAMCQGMWTVFMILVPTPLLEERESFNRNMHIGLDSVMMTCKTLGLSRTTKRALIFTTALGLHWLVASWQLLD